MKNITIDFYHRKSFANTADAEKLLEILLDSSIFDPDKWAPFEPINRPFDKDQLPLAAESFSNFEDIQNRKSKDKWSGLLLLKRTKAPKCTFMLEWNHYPTRPFNMSYLDVAANWLKTPERLDILLNFSDILYSAFDSFWFASLATQEEREEKRRLRWFRPDNKHPDGGYIIEEAPGIFLEKGIPGIFWGNYFGPFYVDWFGREKFKTLPCTYKKVMPDGGIFFTVGTSPTDWHSETTRALEQRVKDHLGSDAFFDLPALRNKVQEETALCKDVPTGLPLKIIPACRVPKFPFDLH